MRYTHQAELIQGWPYIRAWLLASRPKALILSFVPIFVGTMLAASFAVQIDWLVAFWALMSSVFIQAGTHFVNDALDVKKGVDTKERIGPRRVTQSGLIPLKYVLNAGFFCFALALLCGIPLIIQGGWPILALLIISVVNGYIYTGGPFPLAYWGLGDPFAFLFFGLVNTATAFYLQTGEFNGLALLAGTQMGCFATAVIAMNNLRDREGDARGGRKTLAVCFGKTFARLEITFLVFAPFALGFFWINPQYLFSAWLPFLTLPIGYAIVKFIWLNEPSPLYNRFFGLTILLQLLFGLCLCIGFWLG
jgi:1,4-dihydroxy-2-naphthoate polyprenyltransferase